MKRISSHCGVKKHLSVVLGMRRRLPASVGNWMLKGARWGAHVDSSYHRPSTGLDKSHFASVLPRSQKKVGCHVGGLIPIIEWRQCVEWRGLLARYGCWLFVRICQMAAEARYKSILAPALSLPPRRLEGDGGSRPMSNWYQDYTGFINVPVHWFYKWMTVCIRDACGGGWGEVSVMEWGA